MSLGAENAYELFLDSLPERIKEFKNTGRADWAADNLKEFMSSTDDIEEIIQAIKDGSLPKGDGFCEKIFAYNYRFSYRHKTDSYKEYDGTEVNAPNEEVAWCIFLGQDGEFKLPDEKDYDIELAK